MSNINQLENIVTKYEDVIRHWSSSQFRPSRGQWRCQSPGPGLVLQYFRGVQKFPSFSLLFTSSNEEHLHDNDPVFTNI